MKKATIPEEKRSLSQGNSNTSNDSPKIVSRPPRPHLVLADRAQHHGMHMSPPHASAPTATPQWRNARDQYLNHIMVCRSCYAPTGRHCATGVHLRTSYDNTPRRGDHQCRD